MSMSILKKPIMTTLSNQEQFGEFMVMPGDWGLPSIDLSFQIVMAQRV